MNRSQEMLLYYCNHLHSEWAQKKALAYLRLLAEAEGIDREEKQIGTEGIRDERTGRRVQSIDNTVIT